MGLSGYDLFETKIIVGLGNPGNDYEYTRHNLGFLVVVALAKRLGVTFQLSSLTNGLTADIQKDGKNICLLMPLTYMNKSGIALKHYVQKNDIGLNDVLVICDDLNLEFQQLRIRSKGSDGGHNGLRSVIYHLGSDQFSRLRLGIGQPSRGKDVIDFVLEKFRLEERNNLEEFIGQAVDCCCYWLDHEMEKTMEKFNQKMN